MNLFAVSVLLTSAASFFLAGFVLTKGWDKTLNRTLALFSLALAVWTFAQGMAALSGQKELMVVWTRVQLGGAVFLPVFFLHFIFSLLGTERGKQNILRLTYFMAFAFVLFDCTPLFVNDIVIIPGFRVFPKLTPVYGLFFVWLVGSFSFGLGLLVLALRRSSGEQYKKLLYVFVASSIGFFGGATSFFPIFGLNLPVISHFTLPLYVAVAVYAIVKHKLLDITIYVRRGLVYFFMTCLFTAVYIAALFLADSIFHWRNYYNSAALAFLLVFGLSLVFQPLRDGSQALADFLFFKGRYDYQDAVRRFSFGLSSVFKLEELKAFVRNYLLRTLRVAEAEVCLSGDQPSFQAALSVPLNSKGRSWGALLLGRKLSGEAYGGEDRNLLETLAHQTATALENLGLYQKLIRSESLAALGTLSAGMAHEIRNPLASMKGMTQVLLENLDDRDFIRKYTELVPRQLDRVNNIIEKLLQAGRAPKQARQKVDLNLVLKETLELHVNLCRRQGIEVRTELRELPEIEGNAAQLQQVFVNLVLNAIQAMSAMDSGGPPEGGRLEISSQVERLKGNNIVKDWLVVRVRDNGEGIPRDRLDRIFDPFFTLKSKGSGLGLFMTFRIVQEHGGVIEVESPLKDSGRGAGFTVKLPVNKGELLRR